MENNQKRSYSNIGITEVREKLTESLSKELIAENFLNLGKN